MSSFDATGLTRGTLYFSALFATALVTALVYAPTTPATSSRVASFSMALMPTCGLPASSPQITCTSMPLALRSSSASLMPLLKSSPMGASGPVIELMTPIFTGAAPALETASIPAAASATCPRRIIVRLLRGGKMRVATLVREGRPRQPPSRRSAARPSGGLGLDLPGVRHLDGIAARPPRVEPAEERPHARHAPFAQEQGHARRARLVRAVAIEHHVLVARNLAVPALQLVGRHLQCAAYLGALAGEGERMPQIDHHHLLAGQQFRVELVGRDARDAQLAQEAPAVEVLPPPPDRETCAGRETDPAAQPRRGSKARDLPAERVSQRGEARDPEQRARPVVERELPERHAQHAGARRRGHPAAGG